MASDSPERLHFDELREHRGSYVAHYQPPIADAKFATLQVKFLNERPSDLAAILSEELSRWIMRYPVPVMAAAWDAAGEQLTTGASESEARFWVGWFDERSRRVKVSQDLADLNNYTEIWHAPLDWRSIYRDVPVKTATEIKAAAGVWAKKRARQGKLLKWAFVFWAGIVPACVALIEFFGPQWLALFVLAIALAQSWHTIQKLLGNVAQSDREKQAAEKKRRMEYYYHHCERNPQAFASLLAENLARDEEARTKSEAALLLERSGNAEK